MHPTEQWSLSIKDTLNKGHLSNEATICSPSHIELCTNLPVIRDTSLYRTASWVPMVSSVHYREVPLYIVVLHQACRSMYVCMYACAICHTHMCTVHTCVFLSACKAVCYLC